MVARWRGDCIQSCKTAAPFTRQPCPRAQGHQALAQMGRAQGGGRKRGLEPGDGAPAPAQQPPQQRMRRTPGARIICMLGLPGQYTVPNGADVYVRIQWDCKDAVLLLQSLVLACWKPRDVYVRAGAVSKGGALQRPPQLRPPYGAAPAPQAAQGPAQGVPLAQGPVQGSLPAQGLRPPGAVVLPALPGVLLQKQSADDLCRCSSLVEVQL